MRLDVSRNKGNIRLVKINQKEKLRKVSKMANGLIGMDRIRNGMREIIKMVSLMA